jgi:DNA transformation protein
VRAAACERRRRREEAHRASSQGAHREIPRRVPYRPIRAARRAASRGPAQPRRSVGRKLAEAGITSFAALRRLGAVAAWRRVRAHWPGASLNLLWALEGALTGRGWQEVARTERTRLLLALDDGERVAGSR